MCCYCGAVRYQASGDPLFKGQCHCRECQYMTGGQPNMVMGMPDSGFSWTKGSPKRSEEHTSELQSLRHLVCRLLLEKKNKIKEKKQPRARRRRPSFPRTQTVGVHAAAKTRARARGTDYHRDEIGAADGHANQRARRQ